MKKFITLLFLASMAIPQLTHAQIKLSGILSGRNENPANASTATGTIDGIFDPWSRVIAFRVEFSGLTANASAAHFHSAPAGTNGPVVVDFVSQGFPVGAKSGEFVKVLTLTEAQAVDLMIGNLYVNIHNPSFPGGEIRAQIRYGVALNPSPVPLSARLSGAQEIPANTSTARGTFEGIFDPYSRVIAFRFEYSGLTANASASHFHMAAAGRNGPVTLDFVSQGFQTGNTSGEFVKVLTLTQAQADSLIAGSIYVNIHNASFPGGEIRGQINYNQTLTRTIPINGIFSGAQEVPANTSTATGTVVGNFDQRSGLLALKVNYSGLTANATASHIHRAPAGTSGPVQIDFNPLGFTFGAQSGTFSKIILLNSTQAADLLAGNLYVNIHNASFPGGEIRAQLNAPAAGGLNIPIQGEGQKAATNLSVSLYPNPSSDYVFLNLGNNDAPVNVELFDIQGRLVSATKSSEVILKWETTPLTKGMYFFRVQKGQAVEVRKWMKN
jgi:CHRD domain/Secretion system C-terminal sorting domain